MNIIDPNNPATYSTPKVINPNDPSTYSTVKNVINPPGYGLPTTIPDSAAQAPTPTLQNTWSDLEANEFKGMGRKQEDDSGIPAIPDQSLRMDSESGMLYQPWEKEDPEHWTYRVRGHMGIPENPGIIPSTRRNIV